MLTKFNLLSIYFLAGWLLLTFSAQSQVLLPAKNFNASNHVFLQIGFEPELVTTIGYAHKISNATAKMYLGGSIKLAPLIVENKAYKINLFTSLNYKISKKGYALVSPQIYYAHQSDRAGTIGGLGFELNLTPYWYGKKWTKGIELGWQHTAFAYIKHSAVTRSTFDERYTTSHTNYPEDGWYHSTANRFKTGFTGSKQISKNLALQFSVGSLVVLQKQKILIGFPFAQVPLYINGVVMYQLK